MPTDQPAAAKSRNSSKTAPKPKEGAYAKPGGPRTPPRRHAAQSSKEPQDESVRLKEIISHLQHQLRNSQPPEADSFSVCSKLRWKVNELEKEKLELSSKYNEEVSKYEGQLAKLRAAVERGEAQRQNLEYEIAVVRKEAAAEKATVAGKMEGLYRKSNQMKVHSTELQQRVSDLEKALVIIRQAREEDQHALQLELEERDRLLLGANAENDVLCTENKRLQALLQDREDTFLELQRKLEQVEREREKDGQNLCRLAGQLQYTTEREGSLRKELEVAQQRVKSLEANVESERASHLESKFSCEVIQLRLRDLETALEVEKSSQAEALSSLELMKQKFREVEQAYEQERDKARDSQEKLSQLEKDCLSKKSELSEELEERSRALEEMRQKVKDCESLRRECQQELDEARRRQAAAEKMYESCMTEVEQLLQQCGVPGPQGAGETGTAVRLKPSSMLESLKWTLNYYQDSLQKTSSEVLDLTKKYETATRECKCFEEDLRRQKKNIEEAHIKLACAQSEVTALRSSCTESTTMAERTQAELRSAQRRWESERERSAAAQEESRRLTEAYQQDSQEKLTFLHDLYQRLVAGCVLIKQPEGLLGSFSWPELRAVLQEHADALTSDLRRANEKISHLECVRKSKEGLVRELQQSHESTLSKLAEQVKKQEETWQRQRQDLEQHHADLRAELGARAQRWQAAAEEAQAKVAALEKMKSQASVELVHYCNLLGKSRREGAALLAACGLLLGALGPLRWRLAALGGQKALLLGQLRAREAFEAEVCSLARALEPEAEADGFHLRKFRKCAIAVMAANRLRRLALRSPILFTVRAGSSDLPALSVCPLGTRSTFPCDSQDRQQWQKDIAPRWLSNKELLSLLLSTIGDLQDLVPAAESGSQHSGSLLMAAAQGCLSQLVERLLAESDRDYGACGLDRGELSRRLGRGLRRLNAMTARGTVPAVLTRKRMAAVLQQHILHFTQRLHAAEVERRSLRLELAHMKGTAREAKGEAGRRHAADVPAERFDTVCRELRSALEREQQAQALLHEQAQQLHELGLRLELHSGEEAEKNRTLADAVRSLSEAKAELRRKDQSLRQLGKHLSRLQQDRRQLEQCARDAEMALRVAAKGKDTLASYMKSVEGCLKEVKERVSLSQAAATGDDFALRLPSVHLGLSGAERLTSGADVAACQSFLSTFVEVYQLACSRIVLLEKEISSQRAHAAALKAELQEACLRENQDVPVPESAECDLLTPVPQTAPGFESLQPEADGSFRRGAGNLRPSQPIPPHGGAVKTRGRRKSSRRSFPGHCSEK
ncbi:coiled-coil domain-containing protein 171 [Scleropages formosus]|uniref:Coiled-coil domain containing 171 n=1 Tax=Scleropages formosus TaxID=113540 RepID=A0A8C9RSQ7_SCLFO|nr:coiled-coil domain-containing protein 171 [Scleropages formosus]